MKKSLFAFLSMLALNAMLNAAEIFDSEVTSDLEKPVSPISLTSTESVSEDAAGIPSEDDLHSAHSKKRRLDEGQSFIRPLPDQNAFKEVVRKSKYPPSEEFTAWVKLLPPPTPKAGYYETRAIDGHAVYWKKMYDPNGKLIGFE